MDAIATAAIETEFLLNDASGPVGLDIEDITTPGDREDETGRPGDEARSFVENSRDMIFGNASPLEDALLRQVIAGRFRL